MAKEDPRVYASQVRLLYRLLPIGMVASIVTGLILIGAYWKSVPHTVLLGWYTAMLAIMLAWATLLWQCRRAETKGVHVRAYELLFIAGMVCSGLVWGSTAFFPLYLSDLPYQILTVFAAGGMVAGASSTFSARKTAFYGFAIPAVFPPILVFTFFSGIIHLDMGGMLGLFFLLICFTAESMYRVTSRSFRLRFEKEDLLASLRESYRRTDQANADLVKEVDVRQKAEKELRALSGELEQQVRSRTNELEAANRELSAFADSVAHDLRTPLQYIENSSAAIEMGYKESLDPTARELVGRIRSSVDRMSAMINDLLFLSRVTQRELRREPVNLSGLAREVAGTLSKNDPSRAVSFDIQDGVIASCDRGLLRIVIENIIGNAWKFTSKNPNARIAFGTRAIEGATTYFIEDNGAGFDMARAGKLFRPFARLHDQKEYGGTGIGLATVRRIVIRHGGTVWARSERGKGAVFFFTL